MKPRMKPKHKSIVLAAPHGKTLSRLLVRRLGSAAWSHQSSYAAHAYLQPAVGSLMPRNTGSCATAIAQQSCGRVCSSLPAACTARGWCRRGCVCLALTVLHTLHVLQALGCQCVFSQISAVRDTSVVHHTCVCFVLAHSWLSIVFGR